MKFSCEGQSLLYELFGTDVTAIPGLDVTSGFMLFNELGVDLRAWKRSGCFVSWLGRSPSGQRSVERVKRSKTRRVTNRASQVCCLATQSAGRSKSALGAF